MHACFTADRLKLYFYALTTQFGQWVTPDNTCKSLWQISADLLYGQVSYNRLPHSAQSQNASLTLSQPF